MLTGGLSRRFFLKLNGVLPGRIVVYRDGVRDEEQVRIIRLSELLLFKSAFEKIGQYSVCLRT